VVIGAVVVWRASVVEDGSGDAEETRALNAVNAYESCENDVNYWRNKRLAQC